MHNSANHFASYHDAARHLAGGGTGQSGAFLLTYWTQRGKALANRTLDYFVFSPLDGFVTSGTAITNSAGLLTVDVPLSYAGLSLQIFVNDLESALDTTGKIHGQQVAVAGI